MQPKPAILVFSKLYEDYFLELSDIYDLHIFAVNEESGKPDEIISETLQNLREKNITIEGVVGDRDDTSILASLVAEKLKLPGPAPRSLYQTQHKGVFLDIARKVNPTYPQTHLITHPVNDLHGVPYPGFLRPLKSLSSGYCYIIHTHGELTRALQSSWEASRPNLLWYDEFFKTQAIGVQIPINSFIYQPFIKDDQFTVDAFVFQGKIHILGVTKSIYTHDRKSFSRFDFPYELTSTAFVELKTLLQRLVEELAYDMAGFNLEFFLTPDNHVKIIEFNSRIAGQFIPLMKERYSVSNFDIIIQLALGKKPVYHDKNGRKFASSFPLRSKKDKRVVFVPDQNYYTQLANQLDVLNIRPTVTAGKKLSDYSNDAYSYRYAFVDIAGDSVQEIEKKLVEVKKNLGIVFEEV